MHRGRAPAPHRRQRSAARRDDAVHAEKSDRKTILFAGRMDDGNNAAVLIDALSRIANDVDFIAVLCGDGHAAELERMAAERGLAQRILFPGYVANLGDG